MPVDTAVGGVEVITGGRFCGTICTRTVAGAEVPPPAVAA